VLREKGFSDIKEKIVNPWSDDPDLLAVNSAARVPVLVTDSGEKITESLMIILWLEDLRPEPSLLRSVVPNLMQTAGIAYGVLEAAVHTLVGRVIHGAEFDEAPVGLRRRRTILDGLQQLETSPPMYHGGTPNLAVIVSVTAFEYVLFRFGDKTWLKQYPTLTRLQEQLSVRASFNTTRPFT
jgi:glutathione S-transferase